MKTKTNEIAGRNELFSAMSGGEPFRTYKKQILGKVYVTVWDVFTNAPVGMILEGDPRKNDQTTLIDVWSEKEDVFFRRMNKRSFDLGVLREHSRPKDEVRERTIEEFSDEELTAIINKPFLALQNALNKTESVAVLYRISTLASELEKSEKVIRAIESRLSEVQDMHNPRIPSTLEEEK